MNNSGRLINHCFPYDALTALRIFMSQIGVYSAISMYIFGVLQWLSLKRISKMGIS